MGNKRPTPQHLAEKLSAIRVNFGLSQYRLARLLEVEPYTRLSEFERGRRVPSFRVLIYYSRLAGIPLEFIVDDDIDVDYFKHYLTVVDRKRGELNQPEEPDARVVLYWRTSE
jgi:transcriptional regulator with XRE-family HTH domain